MSSADENPFRPDGPLAQEADQILSAFKSGNFDQVTSSSSVSPAAAQEEVDASTSSTATNGVPSALAGTILDPSPTENGERGGAISDGGGGRSQGERTVLKVEHSVIVNGKTENVEHVIVKEDVKKDKCSCCTIL